MDDRVLTVLDRLYAEDARQREADLPVEQRTRNLTRTSGEFLKMLARAMRATRVLEVGSSNGVSTIWFALAMRETGGRVIGTEIIPARAAEANANLEEAGLAEFAQVLTGDARDLLGGLGDSIDIAFLDAEKDDYISHFFSVFPLVHPGGIILADNVISHDLSSYQTMVSNHPDCETLTLPLDRGLELTLRIR
jgi:caffeoyl-CoA O-methyltransferase